MPLNIIGISALYHDSACCLLQNQNLRSAVSEERISRKKNDPEMPFSSFMYCLEEAGLTIKDIDCIAYYEDPVKKLSRQLWSGFRIEEPFKNSKLDPMRPEREIRKILGYEGEIKFYEHHQSHAASSFYFSGFEEAAILTVDGVGEWTTSSYGQGKGNSIDLFEKIDFPDSIGLLYSTITSYLGFEVNSDEYKVMGLAPYGKPVYLQELKKLITIQEGGQYKLSLDFFDFISGGRMYSDALIQLLGKPVRKPESELMTFHKDIARSLQVLLEEVLLHKAEYLYEKTKLKNLCMAGGVALNCVANGEILRKGPFKKMFVQPAAGDAGCSLGAAALAFYELTNGRKRIELMRHAYLGPQYENHEINILLQATGINYEDFNGSEDLLMAKTAKHISKGKVVGWFQGRMEFGPRALGNRSILADPRNPTMRERINAMVKKREGFRPFAPAVLEHRAADFFELSHPSPFMLETCQVQSKIELPAITHVDGSARVQTVNPRDNSRFASLITAFEKLTDCPILLNTSFNVRGEPIVCTPVDALRCFITSDIDLLVMGNFLIDRSLNNFSFLAETLNNQLKLRSSVRDDVYSFI